MNAFNLSKPAVIQGAKAFMEGNSVNPYDSDTQAFRRWDRGYLTQSKGQDLLSEATASEPVAEVKPKPKKKAPTKK